LSKFKGLILSRFKALKSSK